MEKQELSCKILILGESKVGKSSILNRFTENTFTENLPPTLGIDYKIMKLNVDNTEVKLQIWDTAGQERFRSITESFYKGCHGVMLVFDLTDRETFYKVRGWIGDIKEKAGEKVVICVVGNKLDLKDGDGVDVVANEEIEELCVAYDLKYYHVSAKEDINIKESFAYIAKLVKDKLVGASGENGVDLNNNGGKKKPCCN